MHMKLYGIYNVSDTEPNFMGIGSNSEVIEIDTIEERMITA